MKQHPILALAASIILLSITTPGLVAQGMPMASDSALASPSPSPASNPANGGPLLGTWQVERAVYDLYMSLKDVTNQDPAFYTSLSFGALGKGRVTYNGNGGTAEMEYDQREQVLTLALGSRLKPQIDLYRLVILDDGTMFLKSQRLAAKNGTIHYLLRKAP